ncbi:MAG: leucyl aminopeptidase family protein [Rhodospirillaceae bacterium]|nr:leucyl aminopeptidase family protein [Rhodospirillaceae bacterium]MBT5243366.1 leucyl aminopeptidase family protein [Rhodospirillaceae bacterium]MBT5561271.1 leucyl aminopeptidase family protein [Rhodospirillaceae bacterium]MBT6243346.1 leucyl aminopeptidase family protein [Rhodospirillaceae bacterium]MBT7139034.1 leucyl aminopeptidase family protein [Rhodospirillaceae bacterium]
MPLNLIEDAADSIALTTLAGAEALALWLADQPDRISSWVEATGFNAKAGTHCLIADEQGNLERVLTGLGDDDPSGLWTWAGVSAGLPARNYHLENDLGPDEAYRAALGWALAGYGFSRYASQQTDDEIDMPCLLWPKTCERDAVSRAARATFLVRDLVNTPASDMGPEQLADAAQALAETHDASFQVIVGDDLLDHAFPAVHAVGRASTRSPRLIDLQWGDPESPKVTLVGKGVCFDSGGLDLKGAAGMKLMKKDMGGAAHVLGLASMIMAAVLPVRLRVLIPAVENSVSGNAMRPLDVITMGNGMSVEIGNTDAEGRLVLADALSAACQETPDLLIDMATLTGAARVALGTELPALFTNDDDLARQLARHSGAENDPLWRLPLWQPYAKLIEGKVADLNNAAEGGLAGAITAALFLEAFVNEGTSWAHIDLMAWNTTSSAGRPEGGEAMSMRALFALLKERFA